MKKIKNILIILLLIVSFFNLYRKNVLISFKAIKNSVLKNEMKREEEALLKLKKYIPKGEIVGYIGEKDFELYKTQFFLAPNLLDAEKIKRKYVLIKIYPDSKYEFPASFKYKEVFRIGSFLLLKRI